MKKENGQYIINDNYQVVLKELIEHFLEKRETGGVSESETDFVRTELEADENNHLSLDQLTLERWKRGDLPG